jgi:hypothetical protein
VPAAPSDGPETRPGRSFQRYAFNTFNLPHPTMKLPFVTLLLLAAAASAHAVKPCDELKSEIAAKLDAAGVKSYALAIVPADQAGDAKVVGSCERGSKKITYSKK